jgi:hypothetical protein
VDNLRLLSGLERSFQMPATYDDAALVIQLARWGTEMGLDDAMHAIFGESFDSTSGSLEDASVRRLLNFGEVVGTLVKQGVLDRDLVLDLWWVEGLWERLRPAAESERDRLGERRLYENMEALAKSAGA